MSATPRKKPARPRPRGPWAARARVADCGRGSEQRAEFQVEDGLGVGLVAGLGIVAGEREQVDEAECGGADQLALQRDAVAVAACELKDRLDALKMRRCAATVELRCARARRRRR